MRLSSILVAAALLATPAAFAQAPTPVHAHTAALYRCPMHPDVAEPAPGRCPRCGMALQQDANVPEATEHTGHGAAVQDAAHGSYGASAEDAAHEGHGDAAQDPAHESHDAAAQDSAHGDHDAAAQDSAHEGDDAAAQDSAHMGHGDAHQSAAHEGHAAAEGSPHAGHGTAGADMPRAPLGLGMEREGSGTAWQPDATPVFGHHFMPGAGWMLMLHYNVHAGYDWQGGPRGDQQFTSGNWVMLMGEHALGGGVFAARLMLSAEPFTTGGKDGYPLLLQSGEEVGGVPLHDRQHPHDLFMEVAASYRHALSRDLAFELYVAPSGEPALGPVAFPHRYSASMNPFAVLGHHWQDSTHVAFGVATAGLYGRAWKLEGSWFNGREPDEDRYDFDLRKPDSYSGRLTVNPTRELSLQVSGGYLKSPEGHAPDEDQVRLTASAQYTRELSNGAWATTAVWGQNRGHGPASNALLLESLVERGPHAVFARTELVQKGEEDLTLPDEVLGGDHHRLFTVGTLQLGYVHHLKPVGGVQLGLGALGAVNSVPAALEGLYGSRLPLSGMVFLQLRPAPVWAQR